MRKININKKILLLIIPIILLIAYYFFYRKSGIYQEFEESSNLEELISYEETTKNKTEEKVENEEETEKIVVHITGEVNNWGVFELEKGSRVIDAVNLAGGFTDEADVDKVNLAYVLTDAIKIYIPNKNENKESITTIKEYITTESGDNIIMEENEMEETKNELININKATQTELETLPGIGPSTALKIISYREENGAFSKIVDIKNVSGIGDNKFENIKELICV